MKVYMNVMVLKHVLNTIIIHTLEIMIYSVVKAGKDILIVEYMHMLMQVYMHFTMEVLYSHAVIFPL